MADLGKVIEGAFPVRNPVEQIKDRMRQELMPIPHEIIFDGKIHRFGEGKNDDSCWYIFHDGEIKAGAFGDWKQGVQVKFRESIGREYTVHETQRIEQNISEAIKLRENEKKIEQKAIAELVAIIWDRHPDAPENHPYLVRKGIKPNGSRISDDGKLMVPLYNEQGIISSLQYIADDGTKRYHGGGRVKACFNILGNLDTDLLFVAEGFATGCTIKEETGKPVLIAYSANNLEPAIAVIREKYKGKIIIVADNDKSGTGQNYASQASAKHDCFVIVSPVMSDVNDFRIAGGNVKELLTPKSSDWLTPIDDWLSQPAPIKWHIRNWVQENSLCMVHGQSGSGKTFVVLDMVLTMATGGGEWFGNKVKSGAVVYLAGEGHHGLRSRIALWCQEHKKKPENMWVSNSATDLNNDVNRVILYINSLPKKPSIVVVDTLHRFMAGDENSAQDAKTMIDACDKIKREFGCTVVLVHHTGVSDTAQTRARGSSAWRGALENEISVCDGVISAQKIKDAERPENIEFSLESREIQNWYDEEGFPVKSAVVVKGDKIKVKHDKKFDELKKEVEKIWLSAGKEFEGEFPIFSRSAMIKFIEDVYGKPNGTAQQWVKPSMKFGIAYKMIQANLCEVYGHGFKIVNEDLMQRLSFI